MFRTALIRRRRLRDKSLFTRHPTLLEAPPRAPGGSMRWTRRREHPQDIYMRHSRDRYSRRVRSRIGRRGGATSAAPRARAEALSCRLHRIGSSEHFVHNVATRALRHRHCVMAVLKRPTALARTMGPMTQTVVAGRVTASGLPLGCTQGDFFDQVGGRGSLAHTHAGVCE